MKRLNFLEKILLFGNSIAIALLLLAYLIPYIDPEKLNKIAVFSLGYPIIVLINVFFVLLWLLKLKLHFLLSLLVICLGYSHTKALFSFHKKNSTSSDEIKVLSYNVRQFNRFNWIKSPNIKQQICDFINNQNADVVCLQEYVPSKSAHINLKYKYTKQRGNNGIVIFSKYKILKTGSLNYKKTNNNTIYVDLQVDDRIIRVYSSHLESFRLETQKEMYGKNNKIALLKRFSKVFKRQANQIKVLKEHIKNCKYPTILTGDFNNTAFSWNYKQLTQTHKDAFVEAGNGFGQTYRHFLPFRIDFILAQKNMKVHQFKTFDVKLSDHFPILAHININN